MKDKSIVSHYQSLKKKKKEKENPNNTPSLCLSVCVCILETVPFEWLLHWRLLLSRGPSIPFVVPESAVPAECLLA